MYDVSRAVMTLSRRKNELEEEHSHCQQVISELRAKCETLRRQHDELLVADTGKLAVEEHINALAAVKQYVITSCVVCKLVVYISNGVYFTK